MRYILTSLALATCLTPMLFDAATETSNAAGGDAPAPAKKSIVPSKYAGKYKDGGSDELAKFINEQASGKDGFEYPAFFQLCRLNGIADEKVAHYEKQVADKEHGSQGRARMTLRNMLATFARKNGKLKALNGEEVAINIAKAVLSGAAAKAQEAAQDSTEATATETVTSAETTESDPE